MKKKAYKQPQINVIEVKAADIICTSGGYNASPFSINGGNDLLLDEEDWSTL